MFEGPRAFWVPVTAEDSRYTNLGGAEWDQFGRSIALSGDGGTIAARTPSADSNGTANEGNKGTARLYERVPQNFKLYAPSITALR